MHDGFAPLTDDDKPMSDAELRRHFSSRLHYWWASLDDKSLFGYHFCFCTTGRWWRFPWVTLSVRREMFHNGKQFIPGANLYMFGMVLQISRERDWIVPDDEAK